MLFIVAISILVLKYGTSFSLDEFVLNDISNSVVSNIFCTSSFFNKDIQIIFGKFLYELKENSNYGDKITTKASNFMKNNYPSIKGFTKRNIEV